MSIIRKVARLIRHAPGIENAEGIWNLLRNPYHKLLSLDGSGVQVVVGGQCALPGYGHSVLAVRQLLEALGYSIRILAIDYEEHWWCQKCH